MMERMCEVCRPWFARTADALEGRRQNMRAAPDVEVHPCPACGGVDWATSSLMVREQPGGRFWPLWAFGAAVAFASAVIILAAIGY